MDVEGAQALLAELLLGAMLLPLSVAPQSPPLPSPPNTNLPTPQFVPQPPSGEAFPTHRILYPT